mgnify:CR=1 FL=1
MFTDLRSLSGTLELEADVCIVGAGIAGLTLARELLGSGLSVTMLESGGSFGDEQTNQLNEGEVTGLPYFSTTYGRTRGFGGTSELWAGQCTPFDACDFEHRHWVAHSGWPVRKRDLDAYYRRANAVFGLPEDAFTDEQNLNFPAASIPFDTERLTSHVSVFSPKRYLGRELRASLSQDPKFAVLVHATATELVPAPGDRRVEYVVARSLSGRQATVKARTYVLACGAIENARLLLVSNRVEPAGIGNRHDLVGRYLQDHVIANCGHIETRRAADLWRRIDLARVRKLRWSGKFRIADRIQASEQVLNATARIVYDYEDSETVERLVRLYRMVARRAWSEARRDDIGYLVCNLPQVAGFGARHLGYNLPGIVRPRSIQLSCITEQVPDPESRVSLSNECDALGMRTARIHWRISEAERRTIYAVARICRDEFQRLDLGRLEIAPWLEGASISWRDQVRDTLHASGTTRMADDPARGVVDSNCQVFGTDNLFVAGSSVFPTSGHANPVFSMAALAIRLGDHVKGMLRA